VSGRIHLEQPEWRVLVANIPTPRNRFLADLNEGLALLCSVTHSSDDFWAMRGEYDIVHMHWPEYITYEMEAAYNSRLGEDLIDSLERRLQFWSGRARIVVTRHNPAPYNAPDDPAWKRVYDLVFSYASAVVHMARASVDEFHRRYESLGRNIVEPLEHAVIPIQNYESLPNTASRDYARQKLGIPRDASVMLVFGAIRTDAERQLILDTFDALPVARKFLLVSNWRDKPSTTRSATLDRVVRFMRRAATRFRRDRRFNYGYVEDQDVQIFLNAADVLFIPRLWLLNSANVSLGLTFGLVTVGPDACNAGELLRQTGNPVFDPAQPATAVTAITEAFRLASRGDLGKANRALALSEWSVDRCAARYVEFFQRVSLASRREGASR
jgi:glycosyltransferase involved in cell wall biosynthesis